MHKTLDWLDIIAQQLVCADDKTVNWQKVQTALDQLAGRFDDLMSFALHYELVAADDVEKNLHKITSQLDSLRNKALEIIAQGQASEDLQGLHETLQDYLWQIEHEVLANLERVKRVMPSQDSKVDDRRSLHFLAWSLEQVLASIDKLEVRGRDSAGIAVVCTLEHGASADSELSTEQVKMLAERSQISDAASQSILSDTLDDGRQVVRFIYKVANLVGGLGDNGESLRKMIRHDDLLWVMCSKLDSINVIAHTRWASNGIINVDNCHPTDATLSFSSDIQEPVAQNDVGTLFVLNGDVDNYQTLLTNVVHPKGAAIASTISTDAKILPVLLRLATEQQDTVMRRFQDTIQRCEGSLAVIMQHPRKPESLFLAQKGSGQSLYIGATADGWVAASEAYGLASRCRRSYPLTFAESGGVSIELVAGEHCKFADKDLLQGGYLAEGDPVSLKVEPIEIFSRDVYLGDFRYYIEKEIYEAPDSVRKTLRGKYEIDKGKCTFLPQAFGNSEVLRRRLLSRDRAPVRRITVVGQGTASVAAMGIAHFLQSALENSGIVVNALKASEMAGFVQEQPADDLILIPVSQSGTTTDTNRVVDLAREQGAWVHAIVNRRNSPLVRKANSYIYTSDGRDVEMAVASTKAYYSQVTAGKIIALWLAQQLGTLELGQIATELEELETLPAKIEQVLAMRDEIAELAQIYAPRNRVIGL